MAAAARRLIDIGANLTDPMFQGEYRGKAVHESDYDLMLERARHHNVERIIITGGSLEDSREACRLANQHDWLYCTVGVHPTRCSEFEADGKQPEDHLAELRALIDGHPGKVVAVGECGLDFDRTEFCDVETQRRGFALQFQLARDTGLPMFLHNRNTAGAFAEMIRQHREDFTAGVAHSFTGDGAELTELLDLGLYIGINGASLKTEDNVSVMHNIPLERLLLETDAPWCGIKPTHASNKFVTPLQCKKRYERGHQVKDRNEPCNMIRVAEAVAGSRQDVADVDTLLDIVHRTTLSVFWPKEASSSPADV